MRTALPVITCRRTSAFVAVLLVTLLNASWQAAIAAPVSSKQAGAAVAGWLNLERTPLGTVLGTSVQRADTFSDKAGNPLYFIVYLDPAGFVIVPADDLAEPIVGFAPSGQFDPSDKSPLGVLVSNDMAGRIARVRQPGFTPDNSALQAQSKWQRLGSATANMLTLISDVRVAPFTQTTWDQGTAGNVGTTACYNYYTPPYGDGSKNNYWAGCVATAMAQLMRYHQFPTAGVGSAGFSITYDGNPLTYYLHGGDGSGGAYVWANMPLIPPSTPTTTQCQAIGALVADAGATVQMSYTASGSSSSAADAKNALLNNFYFANARFGWNNNTTIGSGLTGMINPNLDARYPVLLSIRSSSSGHAVLADGYGYNVSTLYHHLNVGWSGVSTAWYALPLIDTSNGTYTSVDGCVYNVYTNGGGEIISGRVLDQIGRPVANATVTANSGAYTATTDTNGIYALARVPPGSSYSITVTKANYTTVNGNYSTGTSADWAATSGNYWGANFTMPMLTTVLDHLVWGSVATTQSQNTAFGVTITAQNLTNGLASGFAGPVALSAYASGAGASTVMIGNLSYNSWLSGSQMTHGYAFTPTTNVQVTAVRGYSTDKVSIWTDSGTLLTSQAVSASGGWTEATLASPVTLTAGSTYRVSARIPAGVNGYFRTSGWPTTFANGTVGPNFYWSYGDIFPTSVYGTAQGPLVDLRYQVVFSNSVAVSPTSSGAFASGIWTGNLSVGTIATNVVLKADDGAGHTALSSPFNVVDPNALPPRITTQPQSQTNNAGDNATFSLVAASGPTPTYYWRRNGSAIGANASSYTLSSVQLPDSASLFSCVVSNTYGAVTSQTATLTVTCTNVVLAAQPNVTLNLGGAVYAVAPLSDGAVVFGGHFTNVNGAVRSNIARLLPNGTLDAAWNPGANGSIFALAANGNILYAGGAFTIIGGASRNYLAKLSATGSATVDSQWNPAPDYWVETLLLNGSDLYVAGDFEYIGPQDDYRSGLAKVGATGTGVVDANWNPLPAKTGYYAAILSIALSGPSLYVGGYFDTMGALTRSNLAKVSITGTGAVDSSWAPNANAYVYSVALNGADVYVSGGFTNVGGRNRGYIAKLSSTGTGAADATWNPNADWGVWSLAARGLSVYAGGSFTNIGGLRRTNLAKLSTLGTGAADPAWDASCNGQVNFVLGGSDALYVGGSFTNLAGQPRAGLAALTYTPLRLLAPQRASSQFQFTVSGERGQAFQIFASNNVYSGNISNGLLVGTLTNSTGTTNFTESTVGISRRFYRAQQWP